MKKIYYLILSLVLVQTLAFGQTKAEKEVALAVEKLRQVMIEPDPKTLDNITAAQLTYGHSNGNIENKDAFIQVLISGKSDYVSIDLTDQSIQVAGKTAVVRHKLDAKTKNANGGLNSLQVIVVMVWQKQQGQWKLLARQGFKVPV